MQLGGAALAIRTVHDLTGLPINHVVLVDFGQFEDLIDKLGGIDIVVPERIVSKFDCPYPTEERCARWDGWRFAQGQAAHGRPARADLLARPKERAEPGRHRLLAGRAQPAGAPGGRRQADELRDAREAAVHRRRPARPGRDRSVRPTRSSRSAGRSSARAPAARSTAASAARRAAARSSRWRRTGA